MMMMYVMTMMMMQLRVMSRWDESHKIPPLQKNSSHVSSLNPSIYKPQPDIHHHKPSTHVPLSSHTVYACIPTAYLLSASLPGTTWPVHIMVTGDPGLDGEVLGICQTHLLRIKLLEAVCILGSRGPCHVCCEVDGRCREDKSCSCMVMRTYIHHRKSSHHWFYGTVKYLPISLDSQGPSVELRCRHKQWKSRSIYMPCSAWRLQAYWNWSSYCYRAEQIGWRRWIPCHPYQLRGCRHAGNQLLSSYSSPVASGPADRTHRSTLLASWIHSLSNQHTLHSIPIIIMPGQWDHQSRLRIQKNGIDDIRMLLYACIPLLSSTSQYGCLWIQLHLLCKSSIYHWLTPQDALL